MTIIKYKSLLETHIIAWELLALDRNTWNHIIAKELLVLDRNICDHVTVII